MKLVRKIFPSLIAALGAVTVGLLPAQLWWTPPEQWTTTTFALPYTGIEVALRARPCFGAGVVGGALLAGASVPLFGRRSSMALYDVLLAYGLAVHVVPGAAASWLAFGNRLFLGIAVGALSAIIPIYVREMSPPRLKSKLGLLFPAFVTVGVLCWRAIGLCAKYETPLFRSYVLGPFAQYVPFFVCFCGCWATVHAIASCLLPDSPRHMLADDDDDDDRVSYIELKRLLSDDADAMGRSEKIRPRWNSICGPAGSLCDRKNRKALLAGIGYVFLNQVCGMNMTVPFMDRILEMAGSCVHLQTLRSLISIDVIQVIMAIIAMTIIDKVGRRLLLIFSVVLMSISAVGLVCCFVLMNLKVDIDWLPLCLIGIYICAYSIGLGPMAWVMMSEIFSNEVRPYGMSITIAVHWMSVYLILYIRDDVFKFIEVDDFFMSIFVFCLILALIFEFCMPKMHVKNLRHMMHMDMARSRGSKINIDF